MNSDGIVMADLQLDDGTRIKVQAVERASYGDVSGGGPGAVAMRKIMEQLVQISQPIGAALRETGAKRATVEYGIQLEVAAGEVIATFLSIGGQANLNVTLEFEVEA